MTPLPELTEQKEQQIKEFLYSLNRESVLIAQCASLIACFIHSGYITASADELTRLLCERHKEMLTSDIKQVVMCALNFGADTGMFIREPNGKFTPTPEGWFIGEDWNNQLKTK
jgi:hypothetical protein